MASKGKGGRKKDDDCFIIDEEQFELEKEFRKIAKPKRKVKVDERR